MICIQEMPDGRFVLQIDCNEIATTTISGAIRYLTKVREIEGVAALVNAEGKS